MGDDVITMKITIPTDNDGFVLLKCPICGELFKIDAEVIDNDDYFSIFCPSCGMVSDSYFTDDVLELAQRKGQNLLSKLLDDTFMNWEKEFSNDFFKFKAGKKLPQERELPIMLTINSLEKKYYSCCKMTAKIKPVEKISSSYCPYCGGIDFGID